jgi:hypothetical protein
MTSASPPAAGRVPMRVNDGLFALGEMAIFPSATPMDLRRGNGLTAVVEGGLMVQTGIHTGVIDVEVRALLDAPADVETEGWDEVVDLSVESAGDLRVTSMADFSYAPLPALTARGAGTYRVRVHAAGRDTKPDGVASEPVEHYLFLAWPAHAADEVVHQATDKIGQRRRASARR